jgi:hypothetical protein
MAHDIFISYSNGEPKDKLTANAVCATLEKHGFRCWIAPRDVLAGEDWAAAIINNGSHQIDARRAQVRCGRHLAAPPRVPELQREALARADIVVSAVGRADYRLTRELLQSGVVLIDVGTRVTEESKLVGNADYEPMNQIASTITPVPGGVGPVTVAALMENTLRAARFAAGETALGYDFYPGPEGA